MTETPDQRRQRLVWQMKRRTEDECDLDLVLEEIGVALDALLDALEPPVAEMVRRGVEQATQLDANTIQVVMPRTEA